MKPLLAALLCLVTSVASLAQPSPSTPSIPPTKPSTHDFIMDCMKSTGELPHKEMALWIPAQFWEIVGTQMNLPAETVANITKEMSPYMMFCVVDYTMEASNIIFRTADDIRPTLKLVDSSKHVYLPLADKDVSPLAMRMVNQFQPIMAKLLGQFGDGMHVFLFDGTGGNGRPAFDVDKSNHFLLTWEGVSAKWSLPLASVLPPKFCPVDKEPMQ
ncbi:MAG TPA: hypothetical protein VGM89_18025, partial [Puia sp.]